MHMDTCPLLLPPPSPLSLYFFYLTQTHERQERLLADRLDTVCSQVRERIIKAESMLRAAQESPQRRSSSEKRDRESEETKGGLGGMGEFSNFDRELSKERMARKSADSRAIEWERRLEVLKDLVQVCVRVRVFVSAREIEW